MEDFAPKINDKVKGDTDDLGCFCAISSAALKYALAKYGIESKFVIGLFYDFEDIWDHNVDDDDINHCWLEVGDYYIDITATQFELYRDTKVVIVKNNDSHSTGYYPYKRIKSMKTIQRDKNWGRQAPRVRYNKKVLQMAGLTII